MKIQDDEYLMKSLYEECGCKKRKPPVDMTIPIESSPIMSENNTSQVIVDKDSTNNNTGENNIINEGCNCGKRKVTKLLTERRPKPSSKRHILNKTINKKLYENQSKYDVKTISKIAAKNTDKWINHLDSEYLEEQINNMARELKSYDEAKQFVYDFLNDHIDNFFEIFVKYNNIERRFLDDHRDEILDNVLIEFIGTKPAPEEERRVDEFIRKTTEDIDRILKGEEEGDVEEIIRKSKAEKERPLDYSKMSQYDLKKEIDKALDAKDFDTLRKIQPYLKEGFLKYHVVEFLNEHKDEEYIIPKLRKGVN